MSAVATIVMYHFVHPRGRGPVAGLKAVDVDEFREQVSYIRRHYTPVPLLDLTRSIEDGAALPPRPIALTFDDGYRGHHEHVLPILIEQSLPATFFPVSSALIDRRVLDVNKIQCLLASTADISRLVGAIEAEAPSVADLRAAWWKPTRWDPPDVAYVKRLLQHALPESIRRPLVDRLFRELVTADEAAFADELYMSVADARDLCNAGMTIGAHGDRHVRLTTLSREEQAIEINGALRVLGVVGAPTARFAYSYANGEHDRNSVDLLRARGCGIAVTTRADLARVTDADLLTMPRIDVNDLPMRSDAAPNEWTRRAS